MNKNTKPVESEPEEQMPNVRPSEARRGEAHAGLVTVRGTQTTGHQALQPVPFRPTSSRVCVLRRLEAVGSWILNSGFRVICSFWSVVLGS